MMRLGKKRLILALGLAPLPAAAQESSSEPSAWPLAYLDFAHRSLSQGVEGTAQSVDRFFATEQALEEATGTYIRLNQDARWREGEGWQQSRAYRLQLRLPKLKKRVRILVESGPEEEPLSGVDTAGEPSAEAAEAELGEERTTTVTLAASARGEEAKTKARWRLQPGIGVRTRVPPEPFGRLRAIRHHPITEHWRSRLALTSKWHSEEGWGLEARHDLDVDVGPRRLLRFGARWAWQRRSEESTAQLTATLYQKFSERRWLTWSGGTQGDNQPAWGIRHHFARTRYRQALYQRWLFAEAGPEIRLPREAHYSPNWRFMVQLEALIGARWQTEP